MPSRHLLFLVTVAVFLPGSHTARGQDAARAAIQRAIEALGGARRIDDVRAAHTEMKGTLYQGDRSVDFTAENWFQYPDEFKGVNRFPAGGGKTLAIVIVFDGKEAWIKNGEQNARPFSGPGLAEIKEEVYASQVQRLTPLLGRDYQLVPLQSINVDRKPAVGVRVTSRGHRPIDIYFDRATGLPVETVRQASDFADAKKYVQARLFSDYRTIDSLKTATRVTIYKDDKKLMTQEVTKVKYLPRIEADVFAKP